MDLLLNVVGGLLAGLVSAGTFHIINRMSMRGIASSISGGLKSAPQFTTPKSKANVVSRSDEILYEEELEEEKLRMALRNKG